MNGRRLRAFQFTRFVEMAHRGSVWVISEVRRYENPLCRSTSAWLRGSENLARFPDAIASPPPSRVSDSFRFPGFRPEQTVFGIFRDPVARVLTHPELGVEQDQAGDSVGSNSKQLSS